MRIFVSSSFQDLKEHRAAAIRVLRQLGHEVLAMEDMVAGAAAPLAKVLEMVDRSEAYVGLFAWRYGSIPDMTPGSRPIGAGGIPVVVGAVDAETSITHYEYLRAVQRKLPVMAFLLDENCPWPPHLIDGFEPMRPGAPPNTDRIRKLRSLLLQERVVAWFTSPSDLEARVSAAVTMAGLTRQLDLQEARALDPMVGAPNDSRTESGIKEAIIAAGDHQHALKIDLINTWWSTRLYLIASLAERLTQARRILVVDTTPVTPAAVAGNPTLPAPPAPPAKERFIGQLATAGILSTIGPRVSQLGAFAKWLQDRPTGYNEVGVELRELLTGWSMAFGDSPGVYINEESKKVDLTAEVLRRWFGDAMLQQPLQIADLQRATVVDLLRLLDYPNEYVPVITRRAPQDQGQAATEHVEVMDKGALNARLARSYLVELMDRARIA